MDYSVVKSPSISKKSAWREFSSEYLKSTDKRPGFKNG